MDEQRQSGGTGIAGAAARDYGVAWILATISFIFGSVMNFS